MLVIDRGAGLTHSVRDVRSPVRGSLQQVADEFPTSLDVDRRLAHLPAGGFQIADRLERPALPVLEAVIELVAIVRELVEPPPPITRVPGETSCASPATRIRSRWRPTPSDLLAPIVHLKPELPAFECREHPTELLPGE